MTVWVPFVAPEASPVCPSAAEPHRNVVSRKYRVAFILLRISGYEPRGTHLQPSFAGLSGVAVCRAPRVMPCSGGRVGSACQQTRPVNRRNLLLGIQAKTARALPSTKRGLAVRKEETWLPKNQGVKPCRRGFTPNAEYRIIQSGHGERHSGAGLGMLRLGIIRGHPGRRAKRPQA
jgi:hypothetical protein